MDIQVLASGSKANCYRVSDGRTNLLIECGLPIHRIQEGLHFRLSEIHGVLVSHCHQDHAKAAKDLLRRGIDVYTSRLTAEALGLTGHRLHIVKHLQGFKIGTFSLAPFSVYHDAPGSLAFYMASIETKERLLFLTDSAFCKHRFVGWTHLMVECNYIRDILEGNVEAGIVPHSLRDRLIQSHMGLEGVKELLRLNDLDKLREIWLIHMSETNCDPKRAKREVQELAGVPVYIA